MRTRKTQNIKINMTCGSDFRLKKLHLFLHTFLTFSPISFPEPAILGKEREALG